MAALSTGAGVKVAILDTGIDATHPTLSGAVINGWDYVDDDSTPGDVLGGTVSGHGTFIAGLVHLVAPNAKVIGMRVLDPDGFGDGYAIAEAIHDAVMMGARVVNLSLGTSQKIESEVLTDMIRWARGRGVLTTAAAGNDGSTAQQWPAAQTEVISVAAMAADNTALAPYSNRGSWIDFAALGTDLISLRSGGGYDAWSGTSMATPVVSGQLALIIAADPGVRYYDLEDHLKRTTRRVSGVSLRYGRIDILRSVQRALDPPDDD